MIYLFSFIIVLGIPVFLHELGHFLAAKSVGIKVEKFYVGFNFFGLGIKKIYKETEYGIGLFPIGGYVKVAGILDENLDVKSKGEKYEFRTKNTFQKIWFLSAGVLMNFLLAVIVFTFFLVYEGFPEIIDKPIIKDVHEYISENEFSPAHSVGMLPGDEIISVNGVDVNTFSNLRDIISNNPEKEVSIVWDRSGKEYHSLIKPYKNTVFENGKLIDIGVIGISPDFKIIEVGLIKAISLSITQTFSWIKFMSISIWALINGNISIDQLSGPLGIAKIAGDTAQTRGIADLFKLMAIISINLGLINILPLPVVDGGHVLIAIIEGVINREIPLKIKYGIQLTGFILLMSLFIFIIINDIKNIF